MKINESSLLCQQFIPNFCALLETSARKKSGLFTILISEPQCTHSTKTDILQTGKIRITATVITIFRPDRLSC